MNRDPTELSPDVIGSQVDMLLGDVPTEKAQEEEKRMGPPSERERVHRRMTITFPYPEWRQAIDAQAKDWKLNVSDFLTFCVAYTMAGIESGKVTRPRGQRKFHHRAGQMLELPWDPE